jgi:Winged helix-turn helix
MPSPRSSLDASVVPLNLNFKIALTPMPNGPTMREIVIDTETTGLDPTEGHRVVEIGSRCLSPAKTRRIRGISDGCLIYNLLARHQWRKLMPRPFHPERDEEAQEAYKKRLSPGREESASHCCGQRPALASYVRR